MGSWRVVIGAVLRCYSDTCSVLNHLHEILGALYFCFRKANNIDVVFSILPELMIEITLRGEWFFRWADRTIFHNRFHKRKSRLKFQGSFLFPWKYHLQPVNKDLLHRLHFQALCVFFHFQSVHMQSKKLWPHQKRNLLMAWQRLYRSAINQTITCSLVAN